MIKIEDVENAQNQWGSGIVKIGQLKDSFKECRMYTLDFINKMYNFENGSVQFKPTKGQLLIWPAAFTHTHRAAKDLEEDKYIATGWFHYDNPFNTKK